MITKEWLHKEFDKINTNIYHEINGYGNIDHIVNVFNKYLETEVKNCNKPAVSKCDGVERRALLLALMDFAINQDREPETSTAELMVDAFIKSQQ